MGVDVEVACFARRDGNLRLGRESPQVLANECALQTYFFSLSKMSMGSGNTIVEARSPAISWSAAK